MTKHIDNNVEDKLNQYIVQFPDEYEINGTIDSLRQYVPTKQPIFNKFRQRFLKLMQQAKMEVHFIRKAYWMISIALYITGYFATISKVYNPITTLIILGPIPFTIGLLEVFKSRDQGLFEMEMACKFSANEIILARLLLTGFFNLILNTLLTLAFSPFFKTTTLLNIVLLWFTPFTLFTAIALWLSMKTRGRKLTLTLTPLWILFSQFILTNYKWGPFILELHFVFHLFFMFIGLSLFFFQMKQLMNKYTTYEEVSLIEINN